MTLKEIKDRLDTLKVKCGSLILTVEEIEPLVKEAAEHFGLAGELVSVTNVRTGLLTWEYSFIYNGVAYVKYVRIFENHMYLGWVETCTLNLIGAVLAKENPSIAKEIKEIFNE